MRFLLIGGALMLISGQVHAEYGPSWWYDATNPVIVSGAQSRNLAIANTGQLKWLAKRAKALFDANLSGGADTAINNLVASFKPQIGVTYTSDELKVIKRDNYAPLNIAQLKAVAELFYLRLHNVGYDTARGLKANGYVPAWTSYYPWETNPLAPKSENYRPVTLGQLKLVFSFDLVDSNHNGILDYSEGVYPVESVTPEDSDGDGVPDSSDAFPHDPTQSVSLVTSPSDHTSPTITILNPSGAILIP